MQCKYTGQIEQVKLVLCHSELDAQFDDVLSIHAHESDVLYEDYASVTTEPPGQLNQVRRRHTLTSQIEVLASRKMQCLLVLNNNATLLPQVSHTSLPPFALQIVVLAAGAVLIVTVTVGRLVVVAVVLTIVYLVFVLVGVGCKKRLVSGSRKQI